MASSMDVDTPATERPIEFHPLAIVHMSDQYTRITTGGSPFPKDAPVVGLLFGTQEGGSLQILDADDIPTDLNEPTQEQQVGLHQAVFSQHSVVGWYRVSQDGIPTEGDLQTTTLLRKHYGEHFLFCSCQVGMMDPDLLPITLYQLEDGVLVGVEKWKLETSPAEKVAVERVVREQPSSDPQQSAFGTHVSTLQGALEKLKDRLGILVQFLQDTQSKKIPFDPELVRQVQGLVCQLGPLVACSTLPHAEDLDELWTLHMAVTAKTVQSVHGYTEKCKQMQESRSHHHPRRF